MFFLLFFEPHYETAGIVEEIENIPIDEAHFPDENFRNFVRRNYSSDGMVLTPEDIAKVTEMWCGPENISDLTGIEYFTALEDLRCYENNLTALDVSSCIALEVYDCRNNAPGFTLIKEPHIDNNNEEIEQDTEEER